MAYPGLDKSDMSMINNLNLNSQTGETRSGRNPLHTVNNTKTENPSNTNPYKTKMKPPRMKMQNSVSGIKQVKTNSHSDEQLKNLKNKNRMLGNHRAKSTVAGHVDDTRNSSKALSLGKKQQSECSGRSESLSDMHTRSKNKLINIPT